MKARLARPRQARILSDVRRIAQLMILGCALGVFARPVSAQSPAVSPPTAAEDAAQAPATSPAQPATASPDDADLEVVPAAAGPADADSPDQPALPAPPPQGAEAAAAPSATATPTTDLHRTPERFGGLPNPDNGPGNAPATPRRARLEIGKAIGETTMRVVRDESADAAAAPPKCAVEILHDAPKGKTREVGTLKVDGAPGQHEDLMSLLKRKGCEAGADAVLIKSMSKTRVDGVKVDHVEAAALVIGTPKPPVDPSPTPKTITVTPDGPAVPKTITVDPGASR
jgi:hypothetical protein